jgi:hypothetical protein
MEPPPALTVCTSTIGSFMGTPAITGLRARLRLAAHDGRDVRARPAHVEGQEVPVPTQPRDVGRADDPARRSREDEGRRVLHRRLYGDHPARRLHDQGRGHAGLLHLAAQVLEICGELRGQVGVGGGRGEPLVLPELRQNLARERDVQARQRFSQRLPGSLLVLRVHEREEEAHRDRLHLASRTAEMALCRLSSSSGSTSPSGPILSFR